MPDLPWPIIFVVFVLLWSPYSSVGLFHHVLVYIEDLHLVYPTLNFSGCWHFDNCATSKFDDVNIEHGGLPHVLPLAVHLEFILVD